MSETFILNTDETVEGEISRAFNNTIFITLDDGGGMLPATLSEIKEVRITVDDGEVVGHLNGWENGIYEISSERYTLRVAGGKVLSVDEAASGLGGSTNDGPIAADAGTPAEAASTPAPEASPTPARSDSSHGPVM